jgi:hypothetical protein
MLTEVALKNNNQVIFNHKKRPPRMEATEKVPHFGMSLKKAIKLKVIFS